MLPRTAFEGRIRRLLYDERGQGLVEYALIVSTVVLVAIAALNLLGHRSSTTLQNAASSLS